MKIPELTKNFRKTFKSVIKNEKKPQKIEKKEHFCQYYPVDKTRGKKCVKF